MAHKTPLYDAHIAAQGRMVDFAGWQLPVQYSSISAEHQAVRTAVGLFDVSHMGQIAVRGQSALAALQWLLSNDLSGIQPGDVRYSPMCQPDGGTLDDVLVYCAAADDYLVVVNAANTAADYRWMCANNPHSALIEDVSAQYALLALQGPRAADVLHALDTPALPHKNYTFIHTTVAGIACMVSRTGYTGEDGFELYCTPQSAPALWAALLTAGQPMGLLPCGLGARDTLRFEACMPLYGHELSTAITPLEAQLGRFVKLDKPGGFIGRDALAQQKAQGVPRKRVGLELLDRGIAREGAPVYAGDVCIGQVTSGTVPPTLGKALCMALLASSHAVPGAQVQVAVRGRHLAARLIPMPFYKRSTKTI